MNTKSYFRNLIKDIGDESTHIMDDGLHSSEFTGYIDTGSYVLNALLSGSIYLGAPDNKRLMLAGETTTGKTFFSLGIARRFLEDNPEGGLVYYDTEGATTKEMMASRGLDPKRIIIGEPTTIEEFRTACAKLLDEYMKTPREERPRLLIILDSLGMLSTDKEVKDIIADNRNKDGMQTKDMTRAGLIRGAFRVLALRMAKANVPMIINNHTYTGVGMFPTQELGGGGGPKFAADQICMLAKGSKEKDGTDVKGNIVHCKMFKNRFAKENKQVDVKLYYDKGLDRYYGLCDLAEKYGIFKKVSNKVELPDGKKYFKKTINENGEKFFTKEILDQIDECAKKEFLYGEGGEENDDETSVESTAAA